MVTKNTWVKGINSDISKLKTSNETYLDALNFSIITNDGDSSYALENTKGNKKSFILPRTGQTIKLDSFVGVIDLDFELVVGPDFNITFDSTNLSNQAIALELNAQLPANTGLVFYYNANYISLYDLTGNLNSLEDNATCTQEQLTYASDSYLLGWGFSNNYLVLITGDPEVIVDNPDEQLLIPNRRGTIGVIWKIQIDNETGQVITPSGSLLPYGSTLSPNDYVVYKEYLNLSRFYNIYKSVKCRYENKTTLRVVFTDFYNDIKTINILQDQVQALPVELINIIPVHSPKKPTLTKILNGGFLPTARYQIWYQLASFQGAVSTFSPLSNLITLGSQDDLQNYGGNVIGTNSAKSIETNISGVDTNYDLVKMGYTIYQVNGVPESFYYDEITIPESGEIKSVLNGTENFINIPDNSALININRPPTIAKTLEVVRNKLFIANTKTKNFDLTFDARVYRFDSSQSAFLYKQGQGFPGPPPEVTIDSALDWSLNGVLQPGPLTDIPLTLDLINPYNDENPANPLNNSDWNNNSQYKYQVDGSTLGGTGANISYKFITKDTLENSNTSIPKPGFKNVTPILDNSVSFDMGNYVQNIEGSLATMRSPYYDSTFWGYARGEVYRWAIVFKDLYGYDSFAYWIADIKFPSLVDDPENMSDVVSDTLKCYQLGIEFTVDTSTPQFKAIADKISGWSFVRVERDTLNKTKLGIGMLTNLAENSDSYNSGGFYLIPSGFATNGGGLADIAVDGKVLILNIPSFHKNLSNEFKPGDYLKLLGQYALSSFDQMTEPTESYYQNYEVDVSTIPTTPTLNPVVFKWSVESSKSENFIPADPGNGLDLPFYNMSSSLETDSADEKYNYMGNKTDLVALQNTVGVIPIFSSRDDNAQHLVSYERYLDSQYGGFSNTSRYNNTYISTGHFQPYVKGQPIFPTKVFGGDVVTSLYTYQILEKNLKPISGWAQSTAVLPRRQAIFYPCEAHGFNPFYLVYKEPFVNNISSANRNGDEELIIEENIPLNPALNQENNLSLYVSKPLVFNNIKEEPFTIYGTPNKLDGELIDSWRNFQTNVSISVNGNHGEINRLIELKDRLYYYQNFGVGIVSIDERVLINEGSTEQTQLGVGGVLSRYDYLSTETGSIHQFAVEKSGSGIYHYDALLKKFFKISEGMTPLSDIHGISGKLNTFDTSIKSKDQLFMPSPVSVHLGFDSQRNKIFFTLLGETEQTTYSFNELTNSFDSRHSFTPRVYLNMRSYFLSSDPDAHEDTYLHNVGNYNEFYGVIHPSFVLFRNNLDSPDLVKVFDTMWVNSEVIQNNINLQESISTVKFSNDYQTSPVYTNLYLKPHLRTWRWNKIRDDFSKRFYDKYIDVELTFNQTLNDNKHLILHDVILENSQRTTIKPK